MEHKCCSLPSGIVISNVGYNPDVWSIYDENDYKEIVGILYCPYCGERL